MKVPLVYRREGKKHEIAVRLRNLHERSELVSFLQEETPQPRQKPAEPKKKKNPGKTKSRSRPIPNRSLLFRGK
ncbi:MAG: hypothetical protein U0903_07620 [Planctomycetales bacterium]